MKRIVHLLFRMLFILSVIGAGVATYDSAATKQTAERTITDHAGRNVQIPAKVNKVFGTSPVGTILLYSLCPDRLAGWNHELRPGELELIPEKYRKLPNLGGWYAKNTGNLEELVKVRPDIIISAGNIGPADIEQADRIQTQINIPVVMVDGSLDGLEKAYRLLGDLTGEQQQAGILAAYCTEKLKLVDKALHGLSENSLPRVYYAEGATGLETEPGGSAHTDLLSRAGGRNAAQAQARGGMGMTPVSMEQVIAWTPDALLVWNRSQGGAYDHIMADPVWAQLQAVKNRHVYEIPASPFNWFDRPPSVNRLIGLVWLAHLLHPDTFTCNITAEAKRFCKFFYHIDLSDDQIRGLLVRAGGA